MKKSWRCRLGWHRFETRHSPDGTGQYLACRRCGKEEIFQKPPLVIG